ncbi:MAG: peptidase C1 [Alphaproteobacteria bacterium]|nr:MAG: peptidase C1 [Alphaproteobacteria bacterium]
MKHTVDLRAALPSCRDQGRRRSCLAFAASAAHAHGRQRTEPLSVEYLYFGAVALSPGADPDRGTTFLAVATALSDTGQPDEKVWPYQATQLVKPDWNPPVTSEPLYRAKTDIGILDIDGICALLDQATTVVLGLLTSDSFMMAGPDGIMPHKDLDPMSGGHAVLAVGYGEDPDGNRHVLVRNSWGPDWGMDGHAWLSATYLQTHLHEVAVIGPTGSEKWN